MDKQKINYQKKLDEVLKEIEKSLENGEKKPTLLLHACCGPCSSYCLEYLTKYFQITVLYYNPNIYPEAEYKRRFQELKNLYKDFPPALNGNVKVVELPYVPEDFYGAVKTREEPELAKEPEKGERCRRCYELRLKAAFNYAAENDFDYFCTTLSISPFKDAEKINTIGAAIEWEAQAEVESAINGELTAVNDALKTFEISEKMAAGGESDVYFSKSEKDNLLEDDFESSKELSQDVEKLSHNGRVPKWLFSDFKKKGGFKRSLEISDEFDMYRQEYCGCVYSYRSREEYEKRLKESGK